jgi:hypothetical protein
LDVIEQSQDKPRSLLDTDTGIPDAPPGRPNLCRVSTE